MRDLITSLSDHERSQILYRVVEGLEAGNPMTEFIAERAEEYNARRPKVKRELTKAEVKARGLNHIYKHYEEAIERDGRTVGYRLYANNGLFGFLKFNKYVWL